MLRKRFIPFFFLFPILLFIFTHTADTKQRFIAVLELEGVVNPVMSEFILNNIDKAIEEEAECLIIQLDTPGGLDLSMRSIVKKMVNAKIPVVVYITPSGARAASAGVIITMSSDIAAMTPGTNIGAAHPVNMSGKMDEEMSKKVENDAVAYIRGLAGKKGRNADWAEEAVRESVSITAEAALEIKVIDLIANNLDDLIKQIDGREVVKGGISFKLATREIPVKFIKMDIRSRILDRLTDPNIAYILMILGFYGLFFELSHPGVIFPGVVGAICLILAFFAFQTLPVNYAGMLLILLGIFLFIAEIKVISYGLLTVGGVVSMTLGSLLLFDSPEPYLRASLAVIIPVILVTSGLFFIAISLALKAQLAKPLTGEKGLVGEIGVAKSRIAPEGKVFIHGEYWNVNSEEVIEKGERVKVVSVENLEMKVEKV